MNAICITDSQVLCIMTAIILTREREWWDINARDEAFQVACEILDLSKGPH